MNDDLEVWASLNPRQKSYLECIFEQDQANEREERADHVYQSRPAAEWRPMTLTLTAPVAIVGYSPLQRLLGAAGVRDQGTGSTIAALERRGLIRTSHDMVYIATLGEVPRTRVEITRRGRAAARAGLGRPRPARLPAPLLSEWLWRIVVRVARAGDEGVDGSLAGRGPHYLAVGQRPNNKTQSRGFIDWRLPEGANHGPHRWFLTEAGRAHIATYLDTYTDLYPRIDTDDLKVDVDQGRVVT